MSMAPNTRSTPGPQSRLEEGNEPCSETACCSSTGHGPNILTEIGASRYLHTVREQSPAPLPFGAWLLFEARTRG